MAPSPLERLLAKIEKDAATGCWNWTAVIGNYGYGLFTMHGHKIVAHRAAYLLLVGEIEEGMQLDHLCRNRACVNPAHLEQVTPRENSLRSPISIPARNAAKTHCAHGHPFDEANTYYGRLRRACRACGREAQRAYQARKRAAA